MSEVVKLLVTPAVKDIIIVRVKKGEFIYMKKGVWHFAAGSINQVALDYFLSELSLFILNKQQI